MELIPMLNQKLGNDIDGANFMTFMRGNGQECAEMAREVKKYLLNIICPFHKSRVS